jgi:hypothetical protein
MLNHFLAFYITLDLFHMTAGGNVEHQEQPRKYTRENLVMPEKYGSRYTSSFIKQLIQAAKYYLCPLFFSAAYMEIIPVSLVD